MYKTVIKRIIDIIFSGLGIIILAIPMAAVAIIIRAEDSGPALFKQKRVGQKKNGEITYFQLYKFRSMKMSAPHDVPTHLMKNSEQYFLKCGKLLRKLSIDELPQMVNIFKGEMTIVGPRPALWNQYDLIEEREIYGANDVKPGLTGWAQINGRDELEISVKAKLDGEYANRISFLFDCKCFFGSIGKVLRSEGIIEGAATEENREKAEKS